MNKDRTQVPSTIPTCTVLAAFSAGHPRGSKPAEEYADQQRQAGQSAHVVMDLPTDRFLVVVKGGAR